MRAFRTFCTGCLAFSIVGLAVACGDEDEDDGGSGGRGGSDGSGATGGSGGSGATGGSGGGGGAGGSGAEGSGGSAGSNPDGGAGAGGTAGGGGSSGADASTGGTNGTAGGGSSGTGGSAGADAGAGPRSCVERCTADPDCKIQGAGDFVCRDNRCVESDPVDAGHCSADPDCIPFASRWTIPCSASAPCQDSVFTCIDRGDGVGRCAALAGTGPCLFLEGSAVLGEPMIDGSGNVDVCVALSHKCDTGSGRCFQACRSDDDCDTGDGVSCNTTTGRCECFYDEDCTGLAAPKCNRTTFRCECGGNEDCAGLPERDHCVSGTCSCSGDAVCVKTFDGTSESCQ